ncbi:Dynein heavy chain AAA module D4 [Trinorchestia longiramus]|nr:Dynein heavy chain AAA module D4 [Trinorchestia longiramus]
MAGVLLLPLARLDSPDKLMRLWLHEAFRVFNDRLVSDQHRVKFFDHCRECGERAFRTKLTSVLPQCKMAPKMTASEVMTCCSSIVFADFQHPDDEGKTYDEVPEPHLLKTALETYMADYNVVTPATLSLVMSDYIVQHVVRCSRVLKQHSGHMLMIGIPGCGRRSVAKMSAFMAGCDLIKLVQSNSYSVTDWREDLKKVLLRAGADGKRTVFLVDDTQLLEDTFTEDLSLMLKSSHIPGLFAAEEQSLIIEKIQAAAKEEGRKVDVSAATLNALFLDRIRSNLHLVVCLSPLSAHYKTTLSTFPALVTCCTVDWYPPWPDSTLQQVGSRLLQELQLPDEKLCVTLAAAIHFHRCTQALARRYRENLGRRVHVTSTSFLHLITTFRRILLQKRTEITTKRDQYVTGLQKLQEAECLISELQVELKNLQPQLQQTSCNTEALMIKIEQDTVQVEKKKELVAADEAVANRKFADAQSIKDDCERELAKAVPALSAATLALNTLRQEDVRVVKAMKNPPFGVKLVLEAVCVMLNVKPERVPDPDGSGKRLMDYWTPSQKLLGDLKFLPMLMEYDKDNIPEKIVGVVREKYYSHPDFDPKKIRSTSAACEGLCRWVRAMVVYDQVIKIVAPKKEALEAANRELAIQNSKLEEKRKELREVTDKLQSLNDEFTKKQKEKKDLEDSIVKCEEKRDRAARITGGLGGERDRWTAAAAELSVCLQNILGDSLLAAATLEYLAPFTVEYRQECIGEWHHKCIELQVGCNPVFSLQQLLADLVQVRAWHLRGLPVDQFSVDNAIIATSSFRWPFIIDPQGEATKFIKSLGVAVEDKTSPEDDDHVVPDPNNDVSTNAQEQHEQKICTKDVNSSDTSQDLLPDGDTPDDRCAIT